MRELRYSEARRSAVEYPLPKDVPGGARGASPATRRCESDVIMAIGDEADRGRQQVPPVPIIMVALLCGHTGFVASLALQAAISRMTCSPPNSCRSRMAVLRELCPASRSVVLYTRERRKAPRSGAHCRLAESAGLDAKAVQCRRPSIRMRRYLPPCADRSPRLALVVPMTEHCARVVPPRCELSCRAFFSIGREAFQPDSFSEGVRAGGLIS